MLGVTDVSNSILLSIKLLLITLEFFYKNHVLRSAPTVLAIVTPTAKIPTTLSPLVTQKYFTSNPLMEMVRFCDEENKPLLERSLRRIQGQLGDLELEMSTVRAETDSMETKVEGVDEETRLLRSQIGTLEQDNSALKEETNLLKEDNNAIKERLETLERMVT